MEVMDVVFVDEREDVQKKTFTKWINSQLVKANQPLIKDLFYDLRDGTRLLSLLELLCKKELPREKGSQKVHHLSNVGRALKVLEENNVKLVNISTNNIVTGNPKLTLGLVWSIILHWQVHGVLKSVAHDSQQTNLEKTLLAWCRDATKGYTGVDIRNFTTSWSDGLAFNALIHRFRPHAFDYDSFLKKDANYRLEHAFNCAHQYLGIEKLLDPEDVNTSHPDKKSIMMYVMCFFQALPHQNIPLRRMDSFELSDSETSELGQSFSSRANDVAAYQNTLEEVLTWLLGAEERLNQEGPIRGGVEEIKQLFHTHEEFMLELTRYQIGIGEVLQKGNTLVSQGKVSLDEQEEIQMQIELLNSRWEDLRLKAMDRQSELHETLMGLQQQQLDSLKKWLTDMEDRISHLGPIGPDLAAVRQQIEQQKKIQKDIERQQEVVNSLSNMVVVVDESSTDNVYAALEDQLAALGERWAHVCHWIEDRINRIQIIAPAWQQLEEEESCFVQWLQCKEQQLSDMEHLSSTDSSLILDSVKQLQAIQKDMDIQHKLFNQITERAQRIMGKLEKGSLAIMEITHKLEKLTHRWDSLIQQMENLSKKLSRYGTENGLPSESEENVSSVNHYRKHTTIKQESNSTTNTSHEGGAKKRRLDSVRVKEWQHGLEVITAWFDKIEGTLGVTDESESTWEGLNSEERQVLLQDMENDIYAHKEDVQMVLSQGRQVMEDLKSVGEDVGTIQRVMQEIEGRWEELQAALITQHKQAENAVEKERLQNEMEILHQALNSHTKWMESNQSISTSAQAEDIRKIMEQVKLRLKSINGQQDKISNLLEETRKFQRHSLSSSSLSFLREVEKFCQEWETIAENLGSLEKKLETALQKSPPPKLLEAAEALEQWLKSVQDVLKSEQWKVMNIESMEDQLQKYKELQTTVEDQEINLQYVNRTTRELLQNESDAVWIPTMEKRLHELNSCWSDVSALIEDRLDKLETTLIQLKQFEEEVTGLSNWIEEVNAFLHAEEAALGDVDTLQAQLEQSNALQDDIKTLKPNLDSINSAGKELMQNSATTFERELKNQLTELNNKWEKVLKVADEKNRTLQEALEKSQGISETIKDFYQWLCNIENDLPDDRSVRTTTALQQTVKILQGLRDKVEAKSEEYQQLSQAVNNIIKSPGNSHEELFLEFSKLSAKWTHLTQKIKDSCQKYKHASAKYAEFHSLMMTETDWLDRLEKKLKRSPESAADAEEISENLDDLENYLRHHPPDRIPRIQTVGKMLIEQDIMATYIQQEVDRVNKKWEELNSRGYDRQKLLENSIVQAQQCERKILNLQGWITHVDTALENRLANDVSAQDIPEEVSQLQTEFNEKENEIHELKEHIKQYRKQGRMEAASRLEEQLNLVEKRYGEALVQFQKFQKPPDFDAKLGRVMRMLDEVEEGIQQINIFSHKPDAIQDQLEQCMHFYKMLSDIKSEVEIAIHQGRQIVEKNQTDSPKELKQKLDALKNHYNQLGSKVTEQKSKLENALRLAKKLQNEMTELQEWLEPTEQELLSPTHQKDSLSDTNFIKHLLQQTKQRQPTFTSMAQSFEVLVKLGSPTVFADLGKSIILLKQRWSAIEQQLQEMLVDLEKIIKGETEKLQDFFSCLKIINTWLDSTEKFLIDLKHLPSEQQNSELMITKFQKIQEEMEGISCKIDTLRDVALDLIKQKEKYQKVVEPELSNLNQRWETVSSKIKEKQKSEVVIEVQRSMVTQLRASPVDIPTSEPGTPRSEEFEAKVRQMMLLLESWDKDIKEKPLLTSVKINEEIKNRLKSLNEKSEELNFNLEQVKNEYEKLKQYLDRSDISKLQEIIKTLEVLWHGVRQRADLRRQHLNSQLIQWQALQQNCDHFITQIMPLMKRIEKPLTTSSQQKFLRDDIEKLSKEVSALQKAGDEIQESGISPTSVQSLLQRPFQIWTQLQTHLNSSKYPMTKTVITQTDTSTVTLELPIVAIVPDFIAKVNKLREAVASVNRQLNQPELSGKEFEDFSKQEGALKGIKDALEALKPNLDVLKDEKEKVIPKASEADIMQIARVLDKLSEEWLKLKHSYAERHSRWLKARETWQDFESRLRVLTAWMIEAETILAHSRLPNGELDYEKARKHQELLQKQVTEQMIVLETVNNSGRKIGEQCSPADAILLQEQLDSLNRRWKSLVGELAVRKTRLEEDSSRLAEVREEMEDLIFWLDEMETMMTGTLHPSDCETAEDILSKLKKSETEIPSRRSSLLSILLAGPLLKADEVDVVEQRFYKVATQLPEQRQQLENHIQNLSQSLDELQKEQSWIVAAKQNLENRLRSFAAGDKPLEDNKLSQEDIKIHASEVIKLQAKYVNLDKSSHAIGLTLMPSFRDGVARLSRDWQIFQQLLKKLEEFEQYDCMENVPPFHTTVTTAVIEERHQHASTTTASPNTATQDFGTLLNDLQGWLTSQEMLLNSLTVDIVDDDAASNVLERVQKFLDEQDQKTSLLRKLLSAANHLRQREDKKFDKELDRRVTQLHQDWEDVQEQAMQRKRQLEGMLTDRRSFDERRREVESWLGHAEVRLERLPPVGQTLDVLEAQLKEQKLLQVEVGQWKATIDSVARMAHKIAADCPHDDATRLRAIADRINQRHTELSISVQARGKALHNALNSLQQLDKAMDRFLAWLSESESTLEMLDAEADKFGPREDLQRAHGWQEQLREFIGY